MDATWGRPVARVDEKLVKSLRRRYLAWFESARAATMFKKNGRYYSMMSAATGWELPANSVTT